MKQLCNLEIECLVPLLLVKFGDLALDFFHNLDFALKELAQTADGVVARFGCLATLQRLLVLLDLTNQATCDLFLGARDDKVQELLVRDHRLVVICHQVDEESALPLTDFAFQSSWLQIACEEDEE